MSASSKWLVIESSRCWHDGHCPGGHERVVAEHTFEQNAHEDARMRDWGKDMGSSTWHHVRKGTVTKSYSY